MNKPELYNAATAVAEKANLDCLEEYADRIHWINDGAVIDLGCGDGSFTALLRKKYIPASYKNMVACDISENMINYANERYSNKDLKFRKWDLQGDIPLEFNGAFNQVFSFLAFHWIHNQEKAFENTYNLLVKGGDCFLTLIGYLPIYEVYIILSQTAKWNSWLKNLESIAFVSPYHKIRNPEKKITEIMKKIGYKNIEVQCKEKWFYFKTIEEFKVLVKALEPFCMPDDVFEEFMNDFLDTSLGLENFNIKTNMNEPDSVEYNYHQIIVFATK